MPILGVIWKLVYGQTITLTIVFGGVFCTFLANHQVSTPLFNMLGVYFILSFNLLLTA